MSACIACGTSFQCGMVDPGAPEPCWCTQLPPLPAAQLQAAASGNHRGNQASCYCRDCLHMLVAGSRSGTRAGPRRDEGESAD